MSKQNPKAGATHVSQLMAAMEETKKLQVEQETATAAAALAEAAEDNKTDAGEEKKEMPTNTDTSSTDNNSSQNQDLVVTPEPTPVVVEKTPVVEPNTPQLTQAEKVIVIEAVEPKAENASLQEQLDLILKTVPAAYQIDINRIMIYLERMAPKRPINAAAGAKEQAALYRSIQNIINRQEQYFTQLFSAVLAIFKSEMKGALGDRYRLRFLESIELGIGDRKAFNNLTHLLYIAADPASRDKALETISMERALENGLTAEGRDRVLKFFNA